MLQLENITKTYGSGETAVQALDGVSITFRQNEFVSILGQSGCGKTTLLNLIGGLDRYTTGDLIINGKSTKHFKSRDWDTYRNHTIGFVFQSYNLIPHQTVLNNVELALTLSGVPKAERRRRAKAALEQVGLGNQLRKKPGEMSGGQMQRVAIARALVNDPDIILADEPTGALDTETSVQVMELLKEVAKDRLVIMVTHNPELAEQYSTRIIRMLDGKITGDTAPLTQQELAQEIQNQQAKTQIAGKKKKERKPSMSFFTAFGLSLKNLFTKKGRTALTSFAGSIGIIGIALITSVSQGMTTYINTVQEDTLSSYPLTLEATHMDMGTLLTTFMGEAESHGEHENDAVYQKTMFYDLINAFNTIEASENDLNAFKTYLDEKLNEEDSPYKEAITGVQYTYNLNMPIYTENVDGDIILSDSEQLLQDLLLEYFGMDMSSMSNMNSSLGGMGGGMMSMSSMSTTWQEMLPGDNGDPINPLLKKQYDVIYGSWPNDYNEVMLVVDKNNEIDDMTLYALGLKSKDDIDELASAAKNQTTVETQQQKWSFEEICSMEYKTVLAADCYKEVAGVYVDRRESETELKALYKNGTPIKVSGILRPNEDATSGMLTGSIVYTHKLTEYVVAKAKDAPAVIAQKENPTKDIFTGLPFRENTGNMTDAEKADAFKAYVEKLTDAEKAKTYIAIQSIPSQEWIDAQVEAATKEKTAEEMKQTLSEAYAQQTGMSAEEIADYLDKMTEEEVLEGYEEMVTLQATFQYAAGVQAQMANLPTTQLVAMLEQAMEEYTDDQYATYYDQVLEFSESSYEDNLIELGCVELDTPASINIYASSFENKDVIEDLIADYNADKEELERITYTDYVGLMMSSITTIINAISYVLIAFVSISLIVSSIMIGVITLISVQERTKEIGILRAIGASKHNVSSMFNAETVIIGFASGLLGVGITYLLCIPINLILHSLTGIQTLNAFLPVGAAILLVIISVVLTLFAGIIPSRSAAKKDPVVALRTE